MIQPPVNTVEISQEIQSIVGRRRQVILMFATIFAVMSVYLDHVLASEPPPEIAVLGIAPIKIPLAVLSVLGAVIALRLTNLHYGMVLNGIYWDSAIAGDCSESSLKRASKFNYAGVSTVYILLTAAVTGIAFGCWFGVQIGSAYAALLMAAAVSFIIWAYFRLCRHATACRTAKASLEAFGRPPERTRDDTRLHARATLDMAHHDMIAITSSVGLLVFSLLQTMWVLHGDRAVLASMSPLNEAGNPVLITEFQRRFGVFLYGIAVAIAAASGAVAYCRLGRSIITWSRKLDRGDRAGERLLTDSFLGYVILLIFCVFAFHAVGYALAKDILELQSNAIPAVLWTLDSCVFAGGCALYLRFLSDKAEALNDEGSLTQPESPGEGNGAETDTSPEDIANE